MTGSLALLIRSLRVDSRLMRSHLFRFLFVGLIYFALFTTQKQSAIFGAPGLWFFYWIAWLNLTMLTVAGVSLFATVITEEKEEETLGLLRMAGISSLGLLLGKSGPRLVAAVLLLSVQFPFTFLAITLGGVTLHQVLAVYTSLVAHAALLAGIGLVCSVMARTSRGACWLMSVLVFGLLILPLWLSAMLGFSATVRPGSVWPILRAIMDTLAEASAFGRINTIMQTGFNESAFSRQVTFDLIATAVLYAKAWWLFSIFARYEKPTVTERGMLASRPGRLRAFGAGRAWRRALVWKDYNFVAGGKPMMAVKFVFYGLLLVGLIAFFASMAGNYQFSLDEIGNVVMWTMGIALLLELAVLASRTFNVEMKWKTLPALMMLPTSAGSVAWSKAAGSFLALVPALIYFVVGAALNPEDAVDFFGEFFGSTWGWFLVIQFLFFLHLVALLSLSLSWGALPLGFILVYPVGWFLIAMMFSGFNRAEEGVMLVLALLGFFAIVGVQFAIGAKLRSSAAQ